MSPLPDVPTPRARIADVAREAGVSKAAVSFAFNSPGRLKPQTAERIRQVATTLGYRPHPVARMLTAGSTATIGILSPNPLAQAFANPFFALFAEGVSSVTEDRGFGLLFISPLHGSLERAMERAIVDGVIVIGLDHHHPEVESIRRTGVPTVLVDAPAWPEHGAIAVDDTAGALAAARHLLELGHRDLLVLTMEPSEAQEQNGNDGAVSVMGRRMKGYKLALQEYEVTLSAGNIRQAPATFEGGEAAFLHVWEDGLRPTGVLSMSDAAAAGVLQAARHLGLSVPNDLSIVGFDDLPLTRFTDPPLTTVHQPVRRKGEEAARMLLRALSPESGRAGEHRVLQTRLVVRRSTAPPNNASGLKTGGVK
ncbi:MAG TPA: LacI family DNA-binding transcriptional regulator [Candidatus Limnocylindria bacterium]|nr:LacI family DNA-binding transcriptional regulator [Candidatus Limnocylindria bacterium]